MSPRHAMRILMASMIAAIASGCSLLPVGERGPVEQLGDQPIIASTVSSGATGGIDRAELVFLCVVTPVDESAALYTYLAVNALDAGLRFRLEGVTTTDGSDVIEGEIGPRETTIVQSILGGRGHWVSIGSYEYGFLGLEEMSRGGTLSVIHPI